MRDGLTFALDEENGLSRQQQIREHLIRAIASGTLEPGSRVPSSRSLAKRIGVARNTVILAYQQLAADGYLVGRERSGLFVCEDLTEVASQYQRRAVEPEPRSAATWRAQMKRRSRVDWSRRIPPDWALYPYPFLEGCLDSELSSITEWRDATSAALGAREFEKWSMNFSESDDEKLVDEIRTKILPRRGVEASAEEVLITEGWKQALDLVTQLFVDSSSRVAVEEPGLPELRELLRLQNADVLAQAIDAEGLVVDEHLNKRSVVFVTPTRQAPTGTLMSRARRKALLRNAEAEDALIVELDFSMSSSVGDRRLPALKSSDTSQRVIYISDLCEVFGPGLRLGFVVAPAAVVREMRKVRSLLAGPAPRAAQRIGALLMALGHYDAAAKRVRNTIGERLTALRDALNYHLPHLVLIDPKLSGASIWVTGPPGLDARLLASEAAKRGILIEPATRFYAREGRGLSEFRMGVSSLPIERIRPGVAALAQVMRELTHPALDHLDPDQPAWLNGAEIKSTMSGAMLLCRTVYGDPYTVEVRPDGVLIGKAGYAHEDCDEGEWWVDDDRWCRRWKSWSYGETARFYTVVEGDQIKWYKDDLVLFNRGVLVPGAAQAGAQLALPQGGRS
jgi:GntR family transcriptional regulator/MocR family aminotransferase